MSCQKTRDLLDQVRGFHRQLSACYAERADIAKNERAKLLLDYMSRHELGIQGWLAEIEDVAADRVLDTWFIFTPDIAKCECFECVDLTPDMTIDDIIRTAMWFDNCLREFYQGMAERAVSNEVRDLFTDLLEREQKEELDMVRSALEVKEA